MGSARGSVRPKLLVKRLLVLLPGVGLAWLTIFTFFPWFDRRLPLSLAVLATYCLIAYVGLPALVRLWRTLQKPTHVPTRSFEADGWAADPINVVMLAKNKNELTAAIRQAGWLPADPPTLKNVIRMVLAMILNRPYPTAPFEPNYVFGRQQDLGFQIPVGNSPFKRHHVRFWQLGTTIVRDEHQDHGFWRKLLNRFLHRKKQIWVGAAVFDKGISTKKRNLQFVHSVEGNTVIERDFLVELLRRAGVLKAVTTIKAGEPLHIKHHRFGDTLITDGYVKLCELQRPATLPSPAKKHHTPSYELQADAQTFLNDFVAEIRQAKQSIAAQFYTFEADAVGIPVAKALLEAKKRGVQVRFMVDRNINFMHNDHYIRRPRFDRKLQASIVGEWRATQQLLDDMQRAGIEIKLLNPLGFLRTKLILRDHCKLVAIDADASGGGMCYMGGVNPSEHNASWNDFMVKMRGDMTRLINDQLDDTWFGMRDADAKSFDDGQLIIDARGRSLIVPTVLRLIATAKSRVIIESPYPWGKHIMQALADSAWRGVDVSIIVPLHNNWGLFVPTSSMLRKLRRHGVHVYRFKENEGMTHAKALLIDNTCMFGSSNFNEFFAGKLSEACLATSNASLVAQIDQLLADDIKKSVKES